MPSLLPGQATSTGTARYVARQKSKKKGHYRLMDGLIISSVGIGTYLGEPTEANDRSYSETIELAALSGCNVIDSAINYRCMRSERVIGSVLQKMVQAGQINRDEIFVSTKGGFLPFDGEPPQDVRRYFEETYRGILRPEAVVAGCHSMEPRYLADQIERSRQNLGLETIDLYYLHNPETQLDEIPMEEFYGRLEEAFRELEKSSKENRIRRYGLATWTAFREENQVSLDRCLEIARSVGGNDHHLRAIQLPYNLAMVEALQTATQTVSGERICSLEAAARLKLSVFCSASLCQGRILGRLPDGLREKMSLQETDAQRSLAFVLSTPGVTTALVGMRSSAHVVENLKVLERDPLSWESFETLFHPG